MVVLVESDQSRLNFGGRRVRSGAQVAAIFVTSLLRSCTAVLSGVIRYDAAGMVRPAALRTIGDNVCSRCLHRLARSSSQQTQHRSSIYAKRRLYSSLVPDRSIQRNMIIAPQSFVQDYFSANNSIDRGWLQNSVLAVLRTNVEPPKQRISQSGDVVPNEARLEDLVPQETLQAAPRDIAQGSLGETTPHTGTETQPRESSSVLGTMPHRKRRRRKVEAEEQLPLDASSQLTTAATSLPTSATLRRRFAIYLSLSKPRLSFLILLTTTSAYSLYPIPEILSNSAAPELQNTLSTSTLTFLFLTAGTFLSCACANTLNMLFEPKYDALMTRTRNRPLVRGLVSKKAALVFAGLCGASGLLLLDIGTNPTVAGLSAFNIFLYAGVYTPMKRVSAANTWIGAIVGGIPPLMGWCAAAGQTATSEHHSWQDLLLSENAVGGWLLAGLLFAWQFPHFMSLSHTIRDDYRNAGHKMLAWTNPARNARVALRYSLAMFPICGGLYWVGIVNQGFLVISTACNVWMTREAFRFWRKQGASGSARGLFWASVWQLPLVLVGALVCKSKIWDGVFGGKQDDAEYDEQERLFRDGESLGMQAAVVDQRERKQMHDLNLAMMGFKRPS